jgi:hypothetical protein
MFCDTSQRRQELTLIIFSDYKGDMLTSTVYDYNCWKNILGKFTRYGLPIGRYATLTLTPKKRRWFKASDVLFLISGNV